MDILWIIMYFIHIYIARLWLSVVWSTFYSSACMKRAIETKVRLMDVCVGAPVNCFDLDILQQQLVEGKVMLLCVWLDAVCHRCYDQLWCRHFVKHVEGNTPHISLEGHKALWEQDDFLNCTCKTKLGPSIVFPQVFTFKNQINAQLSIIHWYD